MKRREEEKREKREKSEKREKRGRKDSIPIHLLRHAIAPLDTSHQLLPIVTIVDIVIVVDGSPGRRVHTALRPRQRLPRPRSLPQRLLRARLLLLLRLLVGALELEQVFDLVVLSRVSDSPTSQPCESDAACSSR